ncbi:ABC transporter permease [Catellatospora coxensis]|uniref:Transport permease protein n=1 Tax=Catellatospora coxensis TaxID=310354 RepID=A0A8J3KTN7_9ACTN|nr:ABC transporter permease [Catellatospora coxensis]GIG06013.1 transport permease protein [Catellatospora coxensis]
MSTTAYALRDSSTMLRRYLLRARRYPLIGFLIGIPVIMLLLFVYVFGGTLGDGIAAGGGRAAYANYVTPGILLLAIASAPQLTAIGVAQDMTEGIIARFRTMAIFRPAVLTGHVLGNLVQLVVALAVVVGVAMLVGFRPNATPVEWLAAAGLLTLVSFAVTWFGVACGLTARTVESASNLPMPLILLPFLGSGFVPTDSMPSGVSWAAEYQPFTPVMETLRGLLLGTAIGDSGWLAIAWSLAITVFCYLWAKRRFNRDAA